MKDDLLGLAEFACPETTIQNLAAPGDAEPPASLPFGVFATILALGEGAILFLCSTAIINTFNLLPGPAGRTYLLQLLAGAGILLSARRFSMLYRLEMIGSFRRLLQHYAAIWLLGVPVSLTLFAWTAIETPPLAHKALFAVSVFVCAITGFLLLRAAAARLFTLCAGSQIITHNVVMVGATPLAETFIRRVRADGLGVKVMGIFDPAAAMLPSTSMTGVPIRGDLSALLAYAQRHDVDSVIVTPSANGNYDAQAVASALSTQTFKIRLLESYGALMPSRGYFSPPGEIPNVVLVKLADPSINVFGRFVKTAFDKVVALLALAFFAPLMLSCVAAIKLTSPGPVLFTQKRIGYKNREFDVLKFRSMHLASCNTNELTRRNDPRVFAFGQLMRKLSFDELPQLINVLRGDMSLVGPRPHMPEARAGGHLYVNAVENYAARHRVKPGITGWAQVNGWRGPTDTAAQLENRVAHDLHYIDHWSFAGDIKILLRTVLVGFRGDNAF